MNSSYQVSHKAGGQITFIAPRRLPHVGDIYRFTVHCNTLANVSYQPGDTLEIIGRTVDAPHGLTSSLGNLRVKCKYFTSVWTNIEMAIAEGILVLES